MTHYLVGLGGSPEDSREQYDTLEEATEACLRMAREMADDEEEADSVDLYDGSDDEGDCGGACPEGTAGDYWPHIVRVD